MRGYSTPAERVVVDVAPAIVNLGIGGARRCMKLAMTILFLLTCLLLFSLTFRAGLSLISPLTANDEARSGEHSSLSFALMDSFTPEESLSSPPSRGPATVSQSPSLSVDVDESSIQAVRSLTPAEVEAAWILTGDPNPSRRFTAATASAFCPALQAVANTLLSHRLSMQRSLFVGHCSSYLPCPYPNHYLRQAKPRTDSDSDMYQWLMNHSPLLASPTRYVETFMSDAPLSPSFLFHAFSAEGGYYVPGEQLEGQRLAMRFQDELYERQHPPDCSKVPILIMDYFHRDGGFGSWSHARALALGLGVRGGRTVIERTPQGYAQGAYSNCTRLNGLGGCDIFLAASSCELPDNWRELVETDKVEFAKSHGPWKGGTMQQHLAYFKDRRYLLHTEYYLEGEPYELYHTNPTGWDRQQLLDQLPESLDAYRMMPECWWNRQLLAYHWRMRPEAAHHLLTLVAQSLQLPHPGVTATNALAYAAARTPSLNHTAYWWLSIQALKLEWQLQQIAPGLQTRMRFEVTRNHDNVAVKEGQREMEVELRSHLRPLLSWAFVRHGDKTKEAAVFTDAVYLELMSNAAQLAGLHYWYVGADDLLTPDRLRNAVSSSLSNASINNLFTSALVDSLQNKSSQPLSGGWLSEKVGELTDAQREAIVWRTMLDLAVAQVADVFASVWSSNQPRMGYELATALSDARATAPFFGLDMMKQHQKGGVIEGCQV